MESEIRQGREVKNLDEIKTLIDQSEALKAYARSAQLSSEIQSDIAELNLRATRRLGEISARLESKKGGDRGNQYTAANVRAADIGKTAALADIGVSRQRANEAEKIASIPVCGNSGLVAGFLLRGVLRH